MPTRRFRDDLAVYGLPGDVAPRDIRFDPSRRAFLDREPDGRYRLRVWSEPGLTDAIVVARQGEKIIGYPLDVVAATSRFIFWEGFASMAPGDRFSLAFRTIAGKAVYYVPAGITNAVERLDRWSVPDLSPLDVPAWVRGAVIYQIFPDRFANGDPANDPVDSEPWGSPATARGFQGGDLVGVRDRLDYLTGLGVEVIYLNPVFTSPSTHRYDTVDYHQVDPHLGGNDALNDLVDAAHERGLRVILDASFNHCHPRFFAFQDLVENGQGSRYLDWFTIKEWPIRIKVRGPLRAWQREWLPVWAAQAGIELDYVDDAGPAIEPTYDAWYGVATMPRVNLANAEARAYMLEVAKRWLTEPGVDGWRMDVARYVDSDFWPDFRRTARAAKADAYLIGEFIGDANAWLQGEQFDATMNYSFRDLAIKFLASELIDGIEASEGFARLWAQYPWPVTLANQNLIGSHDTARFLTVAGDEPWRLQLAVFLQLTFPGAPGLYYGDEIEMSGADDPGSRGAFDWSSDPESHQTFQLVARLTALRKKVPALMSGEWRPLPSTGSVLAFARGRGAGRVGIFINRGRKTSLRVAGLQKVLFGEATIDGDALRLPARSGTIVKLTRAFSPLGAGSTRRGKGGRLIDAREVIPFRMCWE
ncbi:MAG: alpha-amylase family glycosyl hydrolase [Acidimicrobiia bacterium]|nr:alpha-amylase family glycosyl hydrolase [Actinomycetota bacterium]